MKKLLIAVAVLLVLIIGGFFAFYSTLDEENYKNQVIAATKELTGRNMTVTGPVDVRLFPIPTITLNDVKIKNLPGSANPDLVSIKQVVATIQWGSLFENPLIIESVALKEPAFYLERDKKGQPNWDFPFLMDKGLKPGQDALLGKSILEVPPQFKSLSIQKGAVSYVGAVSGFKQTIANINGELTSDSLSGPFQFKGTFDLNGNPIRTVLTSGKISATQEADIKLDLTDPESRAQLTLTGKVDNLVKSANMTGGFNFNIPRLAPFLKTTLGYTGLPDTLEKPIVGTSTFAFSSEKAEFKDIALRLGTEELENSTSASVSFVYPTSLNSKTNVQISLLLSKFDLDSFMPLLPNRDEAASRFMAFNRMFKANIDLSLKATSVLYRQATLTGTTLKLKSREGLVTIEDFSTVLPEKTNLSFKGDINVIDNAPITTLNVTVDTKNASKTLAWLGLDNETYFKPAGLEEVKAKTTVMIRPTDITFDKIDVVANGGSIRGAMAFSRTEKKPTGNINLTMRNVNLDTYIPFEKPKEKQTLASLGEQIQSGIVDADFLSAFNLQAIVNGTDVTFKDVPMTRISYDGLLLDNVLTIKKLAVEGAATANLTLSGSIQKQNDLLAMNNVSFSFNVPKASIFMDRAMIAAPLPGQVTSIDVSGTISGTSNAYEINTSLGFSQAQIKLQGRMQKQNAIASYDMQVDIAHTNFHQFMRLFNPDFNRLPYMTGTLMFKGGFKGTLDAFTLSNMQMVIGNQRFNGNATVTKDLTRKIKANLTSSLFNLEKVMPKRDIVRGTDPTSGKALFTNDLFNFSSFDGLDLDITGSADKMTFGTLDVDLMTTHFTLKDKVLAIDYVKGSINEGTLSAQGVLNASTAEPTIKGVVQVDNASVAQDALALGLFRLKTGKVSFLSDFNARGNSLEDMIRSLTANGTYLFKNGILSGVNLNALENRTTLIMHKGEGDIEDLDKTLLTQMTMGEMPFTSLAGTYTVSNGALRTSDSLFKADEGTAIIQLTLDIPNWTVLSSIALNLTAFEGFPSIPIIVKGLLHAPETEIDLKAFSKYIITTSAQARDVALRERREREVRQAQMDGQERQKEAVRLAQEAQQKVKETEYLLKLAPTEESEDQFIRMKDAATVLTELAAKPTISETDLKKIEEQFSLMQQRAIQIQQASMTIALSSMRQQAQTFAKTAQERMNAINRIYQRLETVETVAAAYKRGFELFTLAGRLKDYIDQSQDIGQNTQAIQQMNDIVTALNETYAGIAKFDIDGTGAEQDQPSIKGRIIRRTNL